MFAESESNLSRKVSAFSNTVYIEMPLALGLAVHTCWISLMFTETAARVNGFSLPGQIDYIIFGILFLVAFFLAGFFAGFDREHITKFIRRKWAHILIAVCGVTGCILFVVGPTTAPPLSSACAVASALLTGTSCAFTTVLWGEASRRRRLDKLAIITALALIVAFLATILIEYTLDGSAVKAVLCLSPFASLVLVYKAQHDNVSYFKPQEFLTLSDGTRQVKEGACWIETFHDLRISKGRFALKLGRSSFLFGLVFGSLAFESCRYLSAGTLAGESLLDISLSLLAVLLFIVLFFGTLRQADHPSISRKLFLYFFVFSLFTCGGSYLNASAPQSLSCVALLVLFVTMLWFYPAELTHRYRISAMLTFGYFVGFLALGTLGAALAYTFVPAQFLQGLVPTFARMGVFLVGFAFLISDDQMKSIALAYVGPCDQDGTGTPRPKRTGTFTQRCQTTADVFLLSRRELEILISLAKGRNASHIQKELLISEGTVRTHMRNIYRKLDVHNQQELMDLVDNMPTEHLVDE